VAIRYDTAHDSPDDPGGLIRQVLDMGPEFPGPARDILLAWILRLGADRDAAEAAGRLLAAYGIAEGPVSGDAAGELVALLRETAGYPREHLSGRRGAASGRRGRGP
jgi:predicted PhzF superfamily epimerase YddE/YHI9